MKVAELIEKLKLMPPDAPVQLFYFSGECDDHNNYDEVESVAIDGEDNDGAVVLRSY